MGQFLGIGMWLWVWGEGSRGDGLERGRRIKIDLAFIGRDMILWKTLNEPIIIVPGLKWGNKEESSTAVHLRGWASVALQLSGEGG